MALPDRGAAGVDLVMRFDFDTIICDMAMPRMSGEMFYVAVSRVKPHLCKRFIFYTGHGADPAIAPFLATTEQPVLSKPLGFDLLLETVDSLDPRLKAKRSPKP
jgi:DNA-binding NarL/FixJ family response regulator